MQDAVVRWCDQRLVNDVKTIEDRLTAIDLLKLGYPNLSGADPLEPKNSYLGDNDDPKQILSEFWDLLIQDFRARVQRRELHLRGVQVAPQLTEHPVPIPNSWASDVAIHVQDGAVSISGCRYVDVVVSDRAFTPAPASRVQTPTSQQITVEQVPDLPDDVLVKLLEEYVRRGVEQPSFKLSPLKIKVMPLLIRKMHHRAATGAICDRVSREAAA
ncbi:MAG: hypothetical protein AB7F35_10290, partial [Acetobacteraceae bacterium]